MKFKHLLFTGSLLIATAITSCNKDDDDELNDTDRNYMIGTSISNNAEVDAAILALTKATAPQVKAFASHMVMEHGMAQTDLKNLGTSVGFAVKDTIDPAHLALKAQLSALSGRAFDSAYMHTQVMDHTMTVALFQTEQNNGQHRDVQNYADQYLPHIQMHLERADSIANAMFPK